MMSPERRRRTLASVILSLYLSFSATASDCSAPSVLLDAFDKNLKLERDLHAEDIKVEVDGKRAPILSLSFDTRPRRIVLMVDSSGSMEASPQQSGWGFAIPAAAYAAYVRSEEHTSELQSRPH